MDKVTRQCPQTTTFLKRKESRSGIEPRSFRLPALPLTASEVPDRLYSHALHFLRAAPSDAVTVNKGRRAAGVRGKKRNSWTP